MPYVLKSLSWFDNKHVWEDKICHKLSSNMLSSIQISRQQIRGKGHSLWCAHNVSFQTQKLINNDNINFKHINRSIMSVLFLHPETNVFCQFSGSRNWSIKSFLVRFFCPETDIMDQFLDKIRTTCRVVIKIQCMVLRKLIVSPLRGNYVWKVQPQKLTMIVLRICVDN